MYVCVYVCAWHVHVHVHVIVIPWELYLWHSFPHIWFFLGGKERRRAVDRWLGWDEMTDQEAMEQLEKKQLLRV